jgi:hypothetical protein
MPDALHPALAELASELDDARQHLLAVWASIPPEDRERRPAPDAWTPAEIVDHLRVVEGGSTRLLTRRLERAREGGLGAEASGASRLGGLAAYDLPNNPARVAAPESVCPTPDARAGDAEEGLAATRDGLRALLAAANGSALGEVRAHHLRFGDLDMYQWLEFIALHERRHARQLERVRDALAGQAAAGG